MKDTQIAMPPLPAWQAEEEHTASHSRNTKHVLVRISSSRFQDQQDPTLENRDFSSQVRLTAFYKHLAPCLLSRDSCQATGMDVPKGRTSLQCFQSNIQV